VRDELFYIFPGELPVFRKSAYIKIDIPFHLIGKPFINERLHQQDVSLPSMFLTEKWKNEKHIFIAYPQLVKWSRNINNLLI